MWSERNATTNIRLRFSYFPAKEILTQKRSFLLKRTKFSCPPRIFFNALIMKLRKYKKIFEEFTNHFDTFSSFEQVFFLHRVFFNQSFVTFVSLHSPQSFQFIHKSVINTERRKVFFTLFNVLHAQSHTSEQINFHLIHHYTDSFTKCCEYPSQRMFC